MSEIPSVAWTGDNHSQFYAKKSGLGRKGADKDGLDKANRKKIEDIKQSQNNAPDYGDVDVWLEE